MNNDIRNLSKWLNEEQETPIDRQALARVLAMAQQEPVAKPKLIGWRTSDYLMETSDVDKAKNWEIHYEMLPIFEGDPHTKIAAPQPAQQEPVKPDEVGIKGDA